LTSVHAPASVRTQSAPSRVSAKARRPAVSEVRGGGRAFLAADLAVESKDAAVRGDQHGLSSTIVLGGGRRKGWGAGAREAAEEAPHLLGGVYDSGGSAVRGVGDFARRSRNRLMG